MSANHRADRLDAVRAVVPPAAIRVWPDRIWPPTLGLIGTRLWQRAYGLKLSDPTAGRLTELVVTQAGDILGRIEFPVVLNRVEQRTETMLLPISDMWELCTDDDRQRVLALAREFGIRS